jgi:4-azaleucine resistance transporter AzlC
MNRDFRRGLADVWPMMLAYAPIAALWGAVAASKGMSTLDALAMSVIVYSGAAQFVYLDLMHTAMPVWLLVFTIFTVGLRHVLMSASISRHIGGFSRAQASGLLFWLTDEAWAIMERRALSEPITPMYFFGVAFPIWPTWFLFSAVGAMVGSVFGDGTVIGLDFAFAALFISVLAGFWKGPRTGLVLAASAITACVVKSLLPGAWYIIAGGAAGMLMAVLTWRDEARAT